MTALVYIRSSVPSTDEQEAARSLTGRVRFRNAQHWKGEVEPCDVVVAHRDDIRETYQAAGAEVQGFEPATGEVDVEQYAKGGGWYDVPGADKSLRKGEAEAFLRGD